MADQAITALPKKTYSGNSKIAATDYLLGIDSAEGYQMLIQDLGEYIINKVTTSLAGSNQTLVSAISALNSKWIVEMVTVTPLEVTANTNGYIRVNIEKSGYTPIGIVGINTQAGGTAQNYLYIWSFSLTSTHANVAVRNIGSSTSTVTAVIHVLYVKS